MRNLHRIVSSLLGRHQTDEAAQPTAALTSEVFDLPGVVKALSEAAAFSGGAAAWLASPAHAGHQQRDLLHRLEAVRVELARIPELKAWASLVAAELNAILEREGFGIWLDGWPQDGQNFGVVAILDVTVHWIEKGEGNRQIHIAPRRQRRRSRLAPEVLSGLPPRRPRQRHRPLRGARRRRALIRIPTRSGDIVWVHQTPRAPRFFDLYDEAARLQEGSSTASTTSPSRGTKRTRPCLKVTVDLPEGIYATLRRSPRELARDVRLAAAIDWYRRGLISQGRGAEIACVPRADFIDALAARKIDAVQIDLDALERDLEHA
jgi:predicted HTH domain antitoxin